MLIGRWEDEVIWDTDKMPVKLKPKMVSLDPNDDNIILGIPDDIDPSTLPPDHPVKKVKIIQKHVKKSRMLLNRSGRTLIDSFSLLSFLTFPLSTFSRG